MTSIQAWQWIATHSCEIESRPPLYLFLFYKGKLFESKNPDIGMRIIECVQQAIEAENSSRE